MASPVRPRVCTVNPGEWWAGYEGGSPSQIAASRRAIREGDALRQHLFRESPQSCRHVSSFEASLGLSGVGGEFATAGQPRFRAHRHRLLLADTLMFVCESGFSVVDFR